MQLPSPTPAQVLLNAVVNLQHQAFSHSGKGDRCNGITKNILFLAFNGKRIHQAHNTELCRDKIITASSTIRRASPTARGFFSALYVIATLIN